ncbi:MAG: threonine-phosphate decarboxylase CobD [Hyphomicrobium sp.]|uniref:threonine-phosphate decarboxylase CobD n=1 Tax=Hyphomicrobium sp. TaxID=82 RepID=UPI0035651589
MNVPDAARLFSGSQAGGQDDVEPHGGDIDAIAKRYPGAPQPWIDLSTGINPFAYPIPPLSAELWSRLPLREDDDELRRAAARSYRAADPDWIVSAPGTQALIQIIPRLIEPTEVAIVGPTYREHIRCWRRMGHAVRVIQDLDEIGDAKVVVVVNPNNPTGRHYEPRRLLALAEDMARKRGLLVIDEAFADLLGADQSLAPLQPPSTIILRSFGKTYGLAGVRLGFAIAEPRVASVLRSWLGPWAVSGPAIAIGCQALEDAGWLLQTRDRLANAAQYLDELLAASGGSIAGATPLFRLVDHPQADNIAHVLALAGIHVRQFPDQRTWLRFGIPNKDALLRLESALAVRAR